MGASPNLNDKLMKKEDPYSNMSNNSIQRHNMSTSKYGSASYGMREDD